MTQIITITRKEFQNYAALRERGCAVLRCLDVDPRELISDANDVLFRVIPLGPERAIVGYVSPCYINASQFFVDTYGYKYILFLRDFCDRQEAEPWYRYYFKGESLKTLKAGESQPPQYLKELMSPFEVYQHSGYAIYPIGGCPIDRHWDVTCPGGLFVPTLETCQYILQDEFQITDRLADWNEFDDIVHDRASVSLDEFRRRIEFHLPDFVVFRQMLEDILNGSVYTLVLSVVTKEDGEEVLESMLRFGCELFSDDNELDQQLLNAYRTLVQPQDGEKACPKTDDF